jgi:transposase-like protein
MGKIHLNTLHTDDHGNVEETEMSCPRCGNDESSFGFASDGDQRCCKRCQMFFTTRNGDPAGKGLNRGSGPAISER